MDLKTTGAAPLSLHRVGLVLALATLLVAGCGGRKEQASQTAAKVNKDEITVHQINFALQQQRVRPEQADAASRQLLERLIDQQLAVQKADDLKLDRDPRVVQQLEAVRREVLARAYFERVGEGAARPTPEEIRQYYESRPALFRDRRVYNLQELTIEATAEQAAGLRERLAQSASINDFVDHLKSNGYRYSGNQVVRGAEQLPLSSVERFATMKDGETAVIPTGSGLQVVVLAGARSQPVGEDQARAAIEQFIVNDRRRQLIESDLKALRSAAAIEYVGKFAEPAPDRQAAAAPAAQPAASGGLDARDIGKGLGFK
ncbi:peptidyl-prolyl cis-trans isomerase, EpsD family [Rubrivivax gelatinosus]|nr:peptidyl-prolyl cis-trans isomerase, EpsD family [Rubrivivax gelatinosus]